MKLISPDVPHKARLGYVQLGLCAHEAALVVAREYVERALRAGLAIDGILVEEQFPAGHEFLVSAYHDDNFGPVCLLGLGGGLTEGYDEAVTRLLPIDERDAMAMVMSLKVGQYLQGIGVSLAVLAEYLLKLGSIEGLLLRDPANSLIELNPVVVTGRDTYVADAVIHQDRARPAVDRESAKPNGLDAVFAPKAVAVIGASATRPATGNRYLAAYRRIRPRRTIFAVHPTANAVDGVAAVRDVKSLPDSVEFAVITLPAEQAVPIVREAAGRIQVLHLMGAGFSEIGPSGAALESELLKAIAGTKTRILGPNCLGVHCIEGGQAFIRDAPRHVGGVSALSQSGGIADDILRMGEADGIGFAKVISLGNCADIRPAELLEYLLVDPASTAIGLYLEDCRSARRLFELLRGRPWNKGVVLLKGGVTSAGSKAAAAHTGALAGDARLWEGLTLQSRVARVASVRELVVCLNYLEAFAGNASRPQVEPSALVVGTSGGGESVIAADNFVRHGVQLQPLKASLTDHLRLVKLPPWVNFMNPLDVGAGILRDGLNDHLLARCAEVRSRRAGCPPTQFVHLNTGSAYSPISRRHRNGRIASQ